MTSLERFDKVLDRPLIPAARICLLLLVILLVVGIATPLWRIQMEAPQYPQGLYMDIYSHALPRSTHSIITSGCTGLTVKRSLTSTSCRFS
jgi:hypothetical protein